MREHVLTISATDLDSGEPGDPLVVAQASPAMVRAVMRLISESLTPTPPAPRPLRCAAEPEGSPS
jgi:hypothetical protein